jgi:hypothetical protein
MIGGASIALTAFTFKMDIAVRMLNSRNRPNPTLGTLKFDAREQTVADA